MTKKLSPYIAKGYIAKGLIAGTLLVGTTANAVTPLVSDDILTNSNLTTPWLVCEVDSPAVDVTQLDAGLCAYRATPAQPGITYRMSCGIKVEKYSSITLAFLDADDNELATETTEVFEDVTGAYSVTLQAPAGTATAAVGIYGEPGSGFQDCVLVDATPPAEPTKGSITGVTWFDANGDNFLDASEATITGTAVSLSFNGVVMNQTTSNLTGGYAFRNLDVDACYTLTFGAVDSTLILGADGGNNDAGMSGTTSEVCLTDIAPDVSDIDAAFIAVAPPEPPADLAICGVAWVDANGNGMFDGGDSTLPNVMVNVVDTVTGVSTPMKTSNNGNIVFSDLTAGSYKVVYMTPDGHVPTVSAGSAMAGKSIIDANGETPVINLPADGNTPANSACTIQNVNGGFAILPVVLPPTVASDDIVTAVLGANFDIDFLGNDAPCSGTVNEVSLLGHNVPGSVIYDAVAKVFKVSDTTAAGTYSIAYGIRGDCGSFDTASILVTVTEPVVVIPNAPDAPICRVETGGSYTYGGVDVFAPTEDSFAEQYNFYSRYKSLIKTVSGTDYNFRYLIGNNASPFTLPFLGNWETEWTGSTFGFRQLSVYYVTAVVNGVESAKTKCVRDRISPIALDLENQGRIQRIMGDFGVDLDNDGIKEALSQWFAPSAGILVTDDAEGQITGEQMFGNVPGLYADGFAELALRDANDDGELTSEELIGLAIWHDRNSDTIVDEGEISSLEDHKISSLAVEHYKFMARAKKSNGKSILMEDVWLPYAPMAALGE